METNEFDKNMMAITFAEAGDHDAARQILTEADQVSKEKVQAGKRKPVMPMVFFGAISLMLYLLLFYKQDLVMDAFTRGGVYTAWPICTALLFSFIHGAFASNFLSVLGLEAKKH